MKGERGAPQISYLQRPKAGLDPSDRPPSFPLSRPPTPNPLEQAIPAPCVSCQVPRSIPHLQPMSAALLLLRVGQQIDLEHRIGAARRLPARDLVDVLHALDHLAPQRVLAGEAAAAVAE